MTTKRNKEHHTLEYYTWAKLSKTCNNLYELSVLIDNYKKVLMQISRITNRVELETNCKPEEKWNLDYVWNATSPEYIVDFVTIYWNSLQQRYKDLKDMATWKKKTVEQTSKLEELTKIFMTELRRWKRLIRCKDDDMDIIEKKTLEWVKKFVKKWKESEDKYNTLERCFVTLYHTFKTNSLTSVDKNK